MSIRPALLRLLADASDQVVRDLLAARGFKPAPPLGPRTLRRYLDSRAFRDVEIDVFRDEGWGGEGGYVRIGLRSLVHTLQPFELGPHPVGSSGSWLVRGPVDVGTFAKGLAGYLREVALPWMAETESQEAVLAHLERLGHGEQRERLLKAWSRA